MSICVYLCSSEDRKELCRFLSIIVKVVTRVLKSLCQGLRMKHILVRNVDLRKQRKNSLCLVHQVVQANTVPLLLLANLWDHRAVAANAQ